MPVRGKLYQSRRHFPDREVPHGQLCGGFSYIVSAPQRVCHHSNMRFSLDKRTATISASQPLIPATEDEVRISSAWRAGIQTAAATCGPLVLIVALAWPMLFTNASFGTDWLIHVWYLWHQSMAIRTDYFPSLFVNYSHAVFYPEYAFYGGTVTALAGVLSLILGDAPMETYILTYCIGFAMAYGGWYWLAHAANVRSWQAHVPGFIFVTTAPYLTILYGRGDWPEFMAVSAIPLMSAAGFSVLRSNQLRIWPAIALVGSGVVFFGSHNMTLLWGSTFLTIGVLASVLCVPAARQIITRRGVRRVASLLVPALLVSAWFLLPEIAYESHTWIGSGLRGGASYWQSTLRNNMPVVGAKYLFKISRPEIVPGGSFTLPTLIIIWASASAAMLLLTRTWGTWMKVLLVASGMTILALLLMTHAGLILALPRPYAVLQFSFRLESYVLLGLSSVVLAAIILINRSERRYFKLWLWTLIPILLVSIWQAIGQVDGAPSKGDRYSILSSYLSPRPPELRSAMVLEDYENVDLPILRGTRTRSSIYFPPLAVKHDYASETIRARPGALISSNIAGGPELAHVSGAKIIGVSESGNDVLEIDPSTKAEPRRSQPQPAVTIAVSTANSLPVILGRLLTLLAVAALAAQLGALVSHRLISARTARRASGRRSFLARVGRRRAGSSRRSSRS
jgi:hypothetical protein